MALVLSSWRLEEAFEGGKLQPGCGPRKKKIILYDMQRETEISLIYKNI